MEIFSIFGAYFSEDDKVLKYTPLNYSIAVVAQLPIEFMALLVVRLFP